MDIDYRSIGEAVLVASYLVSQYISNTSTPAPNTTFGKVYAALEIFGGIYGKAKQVGIPVPEKPTVEDLLQRIAELEAAAKGQFVDNKVVAVPSAVSPNEASVTFTGNQEKTS